MRVYVPILCKMWTCDVCGYYRYAWLMRNLVENAHRHGLDRFWTLTLATTGRTPDESFEDIQAAWEKLYHRLRRRHGPFLFEWVIETTKAGYAHMHLLVNKYFDQHEVKLLWFAVTGDSDIVHVRRLRGLRAARYLAKYVLKEARARRDRDSRLSSRHLFGHSRAVKFDDFVRRGGGWTVHMESWRSNARWLRGYVHLLEDRLVPSMRIVSVAPWGTDLLKAWDVPLPGVGPGASP